MLSSNPPYGGFCGTEAVAQASCLHRCGRGANQIRPTANKPPHYKFDSLFLFCCI